MTDFDGTLVTKDVLDVVCGIVDKEKESRNLNEAFQKGKMPGKETLIKRINFLKGVSVGQIKSKLDENNYYMPGLVELMDFLKKNKIVVILYSGNIIPILLYYKDKLHIDYVVGTTPKMNGDTILGISEDDFPARSWKIAGIEKALDSHKLDFSDCLAIGDSAADKVVFDKASLCIAINPKGGIEETADYVVNDLYEVLGILE